MDPENCPPGFRSDRLLLYEGPNDCSVPIDAYIAISVVLIFGRFLTTAESWFRFWQRRNRQIKKRAPSGTNRKLRPPVSEVLTSLGFLFQFLFLLLSGLFIVSTRDGTSGIIFL